MTLNRIQINEHLPKKNTLTNVLPKQNKKKIVYSIYHFDHVIWSQFTSKIYITICRYKIFNFYLSDVINFGLIVGIIFYYLCCHARMDKRVIRTLPCNSFHFQLDNEAFHQSRWWIWSSIYSIPQGYSKGPFLWTSWYYIFLPSSINFAVPLGLLLSCLHHFSKPGQHFFGCYLISARRLLYLLSLFYASDELLNKNKGEFHYWKSRQNI